MDHDGNCKVYFQLYHYHRHQKLLMLQSDTTTPFIKIWRKKSSSLFFLLLSFHVTFRHIFHSKNFTMFSQQNSHTWHHFDPKSSTVSRVTVIITIPGMKFTRVIGNYPDNEVFAVWCEIGWQYTKILGVDTVS